MIVPPFQAMAATRLVPVVVIDDVAHARPLARALLAAGLPLAEVTLRTPAALAAITAMVEVEGLCVGAGTVTTPQQAKLAVQAGAQFVVCPGVSDSVVAECRMRQVPVIPGVATASDLLRVAHLNLSLVKFFPAEAMGGVATLRALSGPFPDMRFVPTGGIDTHNLDAYLCLPSVLAVGGSWMVERTLIQRGLFEDITRLAAAAVRLAGPKLPAGAGAVPPC